MGKINTSWHARYRLARNATLAERIRWHVAHAKACACRPVPKSVRQVMKNKDVRRLE